MYLSKNNAIQAILLNLILYLNPLLVNTNPNNPGPYVVHLTQINWL